MAKANRKTLHRFGRPPEGARNVLRRNHEGRWVPDDGARGKVFSGEMRLPSGGWFPVMWVDACECTIIDRCIARMAFEDVSKRYGCVNVRQLVIAER